MNWCFVKQQLNASFFREQVAYQVNKLVNVTTWLSIIRQIENWCCEPLHLSEVISANIEIRYNPRDPAGFLIISVLYRGLYLGCPSLVTSNIIHPFLRFVILAVSRSFENFHSTSRTPYWRQTSIRDIIYHAALQYDWLFRGHVTAIHVSDWCVSDHVWLEENRSVGDTKVQVLGTGHRQEGKFYCITLKGYRYTWKCCSILVLYSHDYNSADCLASLINYSRPDLRILCFSSSTLKDTVNFYRLLTKLWL